MYLQVGIKNNRYKMKDKPYFPDGRVFSSQEEVIKKLLI